MWLRDSSSGDSAKEVGLLGDRFGSPRPHTKDVGSPHTKMSASGASGRDKPQEED